VEIFLMRDGRVEERGTEAEFVENGPHDPELLQAE